MSSIYRPPSSSVEFIGKLSDVIDRASSECKEIIVTSDFNFDVSDADNSGTSEHASCFNLFQMTQLVHDPNPCY